MFEKKYNVLGWDGPSRLTAEQLKNRVLNDSKSNYDWIASATELVRICNSKNFPQKFAVEIKRAILNSFANLATANDEDFSYERSTDQQVVIECFNTLDQNNELNKKIQQKYIMQRIRAVTYNSFELPPIMIYGEEFIDFRNQWIQKQYQEINELKEISQNIFEALKNKFLLELEEAEKTGVFEKSKKAQAEFQLKIIDNLFMTYHSYFKM